ncbi:MAG: STAS domain-containing protein [Planctomycetes bacterium]|nr:STAS domain-containing protein [Planctomycetota bacterium]
MVRPFAALAAALHDGYSWRHLRGDVTAGIVVAIVALPLSMALAIAVGLPPQHGLYTAIIAGGVIALLGGSRTQVSGPTAAFVAILLPIVQLHGLAGLMLATTFAGAMLVGLGLLRFGRYIELVPYPVVTGFTAGIGVTIATGQLAGFSGMEGVAPQPHFHEVLAELWRCLPTVDPFDLGLGIATVVLLLLSPRLLPRLPAPLVAVTAVGVAAFALERAGIADIATIAERFSYPLPGGGTHAGVPPWPPVPAWPWDAPGPGGAPLDLDFQTVKELLVAGITICMLGAIESLLSAVVADGMTATRHDPDTELLAQGLGNLAAPFFGGFAATGAIARTATNIKSGARTPVAAFVHAACLLVMTMTLAPLLGALPIAAMSGLLLVIAVRMADVRHVARVLRVAPRADKGVLLTCMLLTVAFDMVVGVATGMVLASLLFLRRMARLTGVRLVLPEHAGPGLDLPPNVSVYAIEGPLFFGAAERAMRVLHSIGQSGMVVVLDLRGVQTIDATGLVNLQSVIERLGASRAHTVLTGLQQEVANTVSRAGIAGDEQLLFVRKELRDGLELARRLAAGPSG